MGTQTRANAGKKSSSRTMLISFTCSQGGAVRALSRCVDRADPDEAEFTLTVSVPQVRCSKMMRHRIQF